MLLTAMGAVLILGACTALGLSARGRLRRRIAVLSSMLDALSFLRAEIDGPHTPLPDLIAALAQSGQPDARRLFGEIGRRMDKAPGMSLGYHWSSAVRDLADELNLGQDAAAILRDASAFLGRYDAGQQLQCLSYTAARLEACRREACAAYKRHGNVYRTCGIAAGIFVVLILI